MHKISVRARVLMGVASGIAAVALGVAAAQPAVASTGSTRAFAFFAPQVGSPTGAIFITGAGAFNTSAGSLHAAGAFTCTTTVNNGPLAGCLAGQGVRWDSDQLLSSTSFKCTATDTVKTGTTSDDTVVLQAHFRRAGDGEAVSFNAQMIVSEHDLAPTIDGNQKVWVQGVGCGNAIDFVT